MINDPLTPCAPGYHRLYPGIELCADCGALVTDAAPLLTAQQAAQGALRDAEKVLRAISARDFGRSECEAQADICLGAAVLLGNYAGSTPARMQVGFSRARAVLDLWAETWEELEPGADRQMRRALLAYLRPTKDLARQWLSALELDHGRGGPLRRRAAGAEDRL